MIKDIDRVLFTEEQIQQRVQELAEAISRDYAGKDPLVICVLKGSVMFYADLLRRMNFPLTMDFISVTSYVGENSSGVLHFRQELTTSVVDRHVILVEDIFDTGRTLTYLKPYFEERGAASVSIATFLDKPSRRLPGITLVPEYIGFEVENLFVVGYGLDYDQYYRNLPYIGVLKEEIYSQA